MAYGSYPRNQKVCLNAGFCGICFLIFNVSTHPVLFAPPNYFHRFGEEMRPVKLTTKVFGTHNILNISTLHLVFLKFVYTLNSVYYML